MPAAILGMTAVLDSGAADQKDLVTNSITVQSGMTDSRAFQLLIQSQ